MNGGRLTTAPSMKKLPVRIHNDLVEEVLCPLRPLNCPRQPVDDMDNGGQVKV